MRITGVDLSVEKEMLGGVEMIKVIADSNDPVKIIQSRVSTPGKKDVRPKWPKKPKTAPPTPT